MGDSVQVGLNSDDVSELVRRLTYKPGFDLSADYADQTLVVRMAVRGSSSTHVGSEIDLIQRASFAAPTLTASDLISAVQQVIAEFEAHESSEWLKLDGQPLLDPHEERVSWAQFESRLTTLRRERTARSPDFEI